MNVVLTELIFRDSLDNVLMHCEAVKHTLGLHYVVKVTRPTFVLVWWFWPHSNK